MISKNRHSPRLTVAERLSRARAPIRSVRVVNLSAPLTTPGIEEHGRFVAGVRSSS